MQAQRSSAAFHKRENPKPDIKPNSLNVQTSGNVHKPCISAIDGLKVNKAVLNMGFQSLADWRLPDVASASVEIRRTVG